jgi:hypothetical protein
MTLAVGEMLKRSNVVVCIRNDADSHVLFRRSVRNGFSYQSLRKTANTPICERRPETNRKRSGCNPVGICQKLRQQFRFSQ